MTDEHKSLVNNGTWVLPGDQAAGWRAYMLAVGTRWHYKTKRGMMSTATSNILSDSRAVALAAQGFSQAPGIDYMTGEQHFCSLLCPRW